MEKNQVFMAKQKLNFFKIIKESFKLIFTNPNFILITFLTSFPYFCFLLFLENKFHPVLIYTIKSKLENISHYKWMPTITEIITEFYQEIFVPFISSTLYYYGIAFFLHIYSTIFIVNSASMIHSTDNTVKFSDMFYVTLEVRIMGPLITSIYVLILTLLIWIGIISSFLQFYFLFQMFIIFGFIMVALLFKYIEWKAIWNMGMVIAILEQKHGDVAIGVSAYISRGNRKLGFLLMLVMFVYWVVLKFIIGYKMWNGSENFGLFSIGEVFLVCLGNILNWVVLTIYYFDCKKRFLEKKVDVEQGRSIEEVQL